MKSDVVKMFKGIEHRYARRLFLIWVPTIIASCYLAIVHYQIKPLVAVLILIGSFFYWTFLEYLLHRYLFHWQSSIPLFKGYVYKLHTAHHEDPMNRNTFIWPFITVIMAFAGYALFIALQVPGGYRELIIAGVAAGYLSYEVIHHASHHWTANSAFWKFSKRYHALHHYKDPTKNFGVTTSFWDHAFGTYLPDPKMTRSQF